MSRCFNPKDKFFKKLPVKQPREQSHKELYRTPELNKPPWGRPQISGRGRDGTKNAGWGGEHGGRQKSDAQSQSNSC